MTLDDLRNLQAALNSLYAIAKQLEEGEEIPFEEVEEEAADFGTEEGYGVGIRNAVRDLWRDNIDIAIFIAVMMFIIRSGFTAAWHRGAAQAGISPDELTPEELAALEGEISVDVGSISNFALAIAAASRALGGALAPLLTRAELWVNRFGEIQSYALRMAARDQKLMWVWNPLKEHCGDCLRYNGRVYRASVWDRYGIRPRMSELECGGWRCGCSFVVTDDPVTPGRPPSPSGR